MEGGRLAFLQDVETLLGFSVMAVGLSVQVRFFATCMPRTLTLLTVLAAELLMWSGPEVVGFLLKSATITYVFSTFRERFFFFYAIPPTV